MPGSEYTERCTPTNRAGHQETAEPPTVRCTTSALGWRERVCLLLVPSACGASSWQPYTGTRTRRKISDKCPAVPCRGQEALKSHLSMDKAGIDSKDDLGLFMGPHVNWYVWISSELQIIGNSLKSFHSKSPGALWELLLLLACKIPTVADPFNKNTPRCFFPQNSTVHQK